jgi:hypothetical protein
MDIKESIMEKRPNLSQSSIKTYMSNINTTARELEKELSTTEDIISNYKEILEHFKKFSPVIRKTKLSAFIVALDEKENNSDEVKNILTEMRAQLYKDIDEANSDENKQKLTKSQEKNYISWDEVMKTYEQLRIEAEPLFKLDNLTRKQFQRLQDFVLLSMYVLTPPRRSMDFTEFKLRNFDKEKDNYMITTGKKKIPFLVFNAYKNANKIGQQKLQISNQLRNIINKWMEKNPHDYLIVGSKGNTKITQPKLNLYLNNIFGKNIGSSMLRHIYLTEKYSDVDLEELQATTEAIGNSLIDRTLKYVKKKNKETKEAEKEEKKQKGKGKKVEEKVEEKVEIKVEPRAED